MNGRRFDLTLAAESDLADIWTYSFSTWGEAKADDYFARLIRCCEAIALGSIQPRKIDGLPSGVSVCRCLHHFIFWMPRQRPVIVAFLHERMDLVARIADRL